MKYLHALAAMLFMFGQAGAAEQIKSPVRHEAAKPAAVSPAAASAVKQSAQTNPHHERLLKCGNERQKDKQLANQLNGMSCNRFGSDKFKELAKSRDSFCRGLPMGAEAKADYAAIDATLIKFAESCECKKLVDNLDANAKAMDNVRAQSCYAMAETYDQLSNNLKLIDQEWQSFCKGIVSSSWQQKFVNSRNAFTASKSSTERECIKARGCAKAMDNYKLVMMQMEKIKADQCKGKIHETLAEALKLRDTAISSCSGYISKITAEIQKNEKQRANTILYCSSRYITMDVRCTYTREIDVQLNKKAATFEKKNHVNVKEHWCKHEGDMPWCEKYESVKISQEKNYYVVAANKENDIALRICVPSSVWGKCKVYSSSTGQCVESQ